MIGRPGVIERRKVARDPGCAHPIRREDRRRSGTLVAVWCLVCEELVTYQDGAR